MRAAHRFDDDVDLARHRDREVVGVERRVIAAVGRADEDAVEDEQVGAVEEVGHDPLADGTTAEQRDLELGPLQGERFHQRQVGDGGRLGRTHCRDLDHYPPLLRDVDRLFLDQPGAGLGGIGIAQLGEAFGKRVLGGILGIDPVDVLDQSDTVRIEPRGEEDSAEIGSAAAERDDTMLGVTSGKAGDDQHVMAGELGQHRVGVEVGEGRIERIAGGDEAHLVRVHRAGAHPDLAEREGQQRRRVKLAGAGDAGEQEGLLATDAHPLVEQSVGLTRQRRHHRDDLFALADVAVAFVGDGGVIALGLEDAAAEFEDTQPFGGGKLVHGHALSSVRQEQA